MQAMIQKRKGWAIGMLLLFAAAWGEHLALLEGMKFFGEPSFQVWKDVTGPAINADILVLGSSRALAHFDCRILERAWPGKSCYNLGLNGGSVFSQHFLLKTYLSRNRAPLLVILESDVRAFIPRPDSPGKIYNPIQYLPYLGEKTVYQGYCAMDKNCWKHRFIPLYSGYLYGRQFLEFAVGGYLGKKRAERVQGFSPSKSLSPQGFEDSLKAVSGYRIEGPISEQGKAEFRDLLAEIRNLSARLIVVYAPEHQGIHDYVSNAAEIKGTLRGEAHRAQGVYWDFSSLGLTRYSRYFVNVRHLNAEGADFFSKIFTARLRRYLETEGVVPVTPAPRQQLEPLAGSARV